ncbi:uncharacterized protein C8R40DRAFT_1177280 [Lentinula edodes]|uniref:uncharacterized protein n=1 Tax=Lentinula edodes TaxID=5353 RepID=UPI001E8D6BED|nr:uncharacterized protein C8R40DRAFT_1177280 [Lentinula edodes]KAH7868986.1 hypothetical protein C8R40DRAFT_1177280 [Lentinula edodes]
MEIATVKAQNGKISFPYIPVAVFIGGTSGIGRATAEALARYTNGNANIIIVGRNRAAADSIIASFPRPSFPSVKHEFIQCDVTLLKNVRQATNEILSRHSKINVLVISTGEMELFNREITEDGLDRIVVLAYHSRWKFIHGFMPALAKAKEANEDVKVLSVASAGLGGKVDLEDLELKKVSLIPFLRSISTYNDLMVEGFALHFPSITFIHCSPGRVRTPLGSNSSSILFRTLSFLINSPFSPWYYYSLAPEDAGEYQLYGMLYTASTPGAWRITQDGSDLGKKGYNGDENARDVLWRYTLEVTSTK